VSLFKGKMAAMALPLGGLLLSVFCPPAQAIGVLDAYSLALQKDPTFLAALKEKEAGDENKNIGLAGLLPKVSLNYQNSPKNWQKVTSPQAVNISSNESINVTTRRQYRSYSSAITLTQPLIDYAAYARYRAGVAQTLMSDERFRGKFMDLAVRVVSAYLDVAYAKDQIALADMQKKAYREQLALNARLLSAGEGAITDVSETQARFSLAEAQAIEAQDALDAARRELEVLIGQPLDRLEALRVLRPGKFEMVPLLPASFEEWRKMAIASNPTLAAARQGVEVAKYEVERNRGGFFPQVQLYASRSENDSSSDNTINQKYRTNSIGIQVSVPIYAGGGVAASTRQAAASYGQAMYEMDAQVGTTLNDLRKQFNLCLSSRARLAAYELAVNSAATQVEATRKSVLVGQRVNVDVLNAEQQLYSAKRDLAKVKYTYIKAWVSLLNDAGTLDREHLTQIAKYF
jgi:protease secretion system outer membrane protein